MAHVRHALCGNNCLLVRFCLFLQLFVCCGLRIFPPVSPSPWRFAASLHDQLVSLPLSQTGSFDFWHSLTSASSSSHVQSCVPLSVMVPSFVPRSSYAFSTASVCEHMAPSCVVPSTQIVLALILLVLSHDPLMFADLAQICLYQKSPSIASSPLSQNMCACQHMWALLFRLVSPCLFYLPPWLIPFCMGSLPCVPYSCSCFVGLSFPCARLLAVGFSVSGALGFVVLSARLVALSLAAVVILPRHASSFGRFVGPI